MYNINKDLKIKLNNIFFDLIFVLQGPGSSIGSGTALVVHEVKKEDAGLYTCTARSTEGQSTDTVSVHILCK